MPPYFSVCVPTYNRGSSLAAAIQSVLAQEFADFELLICDNASTDNTQEVIRSFSDRRLRATRWPDLVSMYANHNRCIDGAVGKWILFVHSDDTLPPGYLQRMFDEIEDSPEVDVVCNRQYSDSHALSLQLGRNESLAVVAFTVLMNGPSPSGAAYKRESFSRNGVFLETSLTADCEIIARWAGRGATLRMFESKPHVWELRSDSALREIQLDPDHCLSAKPTLDAAYLGPLADQLRQHFIEKIPQLPSNLQARLISRHYQCGYRREADEFWNAVGGLRSLFRERILYVHILPLRYANWLYWPVLLNTRKAKRVVLQRFR
jgi:glycosyltransferase involved in cell wall biosynthesis